MKMEQIQSPDGVSELMTMFMPSALNLDRLAHINDYLFDLANHKLYSIPDLLRLNDFWNEVRITHQSLTDQDGNRRNSTQID